MSRIFLRACAALIVLRSLTNFAKLLQGDAAVLVFFGQILRGSEVTAPALGVGALMLVTGVAIWHGGRWAVPLSATYAAYVALNLLVWVLANPGEIERVGRRVSPATDQETLVWHGALAFLGYAIVAVVTTAGPAWILWKRRAAAA
jgi:hypothetical protein